MNDHTQYQLKMPFKPYEAQRITTSQILDSICTSTSSLIESPTGTGKTYSILCSVLSYLSNTKSFKDSRDTKDSKENNNRKPKIFICTRTHKQISQMLDSLRKLSDVPQIAVLSSRTQLCINQIVKIASDRNDACLKLIKKKNGCKYFENTDSLAQNLSSKIMDIEELAKAGKTMAGCPYFAMRKLQATADIIFAPYNYLVDPSIRASLNIELKNAVVIVDEAHNIEDFCRSAGSFQATSELFVIIIDEIKKKLVNGMIAPEIVAHLQTIRGFLLIFTQFPSKNGSAKHDMKGKIGKFDNYSHQFSNKHNFLSSDKKFSVQSQMNKSKTFPQSKVSAKNNENVKTGREIIEFLESMNIKKEMVLLLKQSLNALSDENYRDLISPSYIKLMSSLVYVLEHILFHSPDCYAFQLKISETSSSFSINFWLLDPAVIFKPFACAAKSVILLSGTLKPFESLRSELGFSFKNAVEAPHVIKDTNICVSIIKKGHLGKELIGKYGDSESFEYLDQIKHILLMIKKNLGKAGGILVFVPSYTFLENFQKRSTNIENIYFESKSAAEFGKILRKFKKDADTSVPICMCVYRGRAAEGMDFKDNHARVVVALGIPYPAYKDPEVVSKRMYNDKNKEIKGQMWYEFQAFRAVNQAIGRVVRHKNDWGAVVFLDSRYCWHKNQTHLPKWVKTNLKTYESVSSFINVFSAFVNSKNP
ncbi:DNA repair helicase (rad3) [Edhazardia aedis USNM 41457]|uniref:DNA 5'-3' helicase n=1 Tax=Edhazardia aedis (strain USNM 41457) TaxID=1003232 RepID=J9D5L9_EDHAE|nr:DNA repair helicase (rad3) [Edhazardia aedis USNM 41457]|eukprot:EJW03051.1 DNA repair helicase (rad3) [Edhazardia aedis USNM 41457]